MIRRGIGVQSFVSAGSGTDADAQAFITAAGITDATQQSAINTLVTDLKGYGIWSKMKAIYPFVGGTASAHKWNLKDPRDLDAAFRLVFSGGGTHASTGWTPNGVNGYGDTKLIESTNFSLNNQHISFYSRTNTNGLFFDIGTTDGVSISTIISRYTDLTYFRVQGTDTGFTTVTNSAAFYLANRVSSAGTRNLRNSTQYIRTASNQGLVPTYPHYIGALNSSGTASLFSPRECAFASIGDGLTDTEAANLYTAVQAYQTTLSRNV